MAGELTAYLPLVAAVGTTQVGHNACMCIILMFE